MSLLNWYKIWSGLQKTHGIAGEYIDSIYPFERDLLVELILDAADTNKNVSYEGLEADG
jgi:hypothetical protein